MDKKELLKLIRSYEKLTDELVGFAEDESTDQSILEELSRIPNVEIRAAVSLNPGTPAPVLKKWLKLYRGVGGTDEEMRIHIVYHPSLSISYLRNLAEKDPSGEVREAALAAMVFRIAKNPKASKQTLLKYYELAEERMLNKKRKKEALKRLREHPKFQGQ